MLNRDNEAGCEYEVSAKNLGTPYCVLCDPLTTMLRSVYHQLFRYPLTHLGRHHLYRDSIEHLLRLKSRN